MTNFDALLARNRAFATSSAHRDISMIPYVPNMRSYVIACIDPRVDPAHILGLEPGDAVVARGVGGRVTPDIIRDVAWMSFLHENKAPDAPWFELVVIHHTECGAALLADDELRHSFAEHGFDEAELAALPVLDPAETARADVERLLATPQISPEIMVSGYVYDVASGLIAEITAPRART